MEVVLAFVIGIMVSCAIYLMLRRNLLRFVFGLLILSNAVNLLIFTSGRLTRANAPLIPVGLYAPDTNIANPLPQALVLTAIVIGFGLAVFALVLLMRSYQQLETLDTDSLAQLDDESLEESS